MLTFFWAHFSAEKEYPGGESMAKAAKEAGLQHTVKSSCNWVPLDDDRMPTPPGEILKRLTLTQKALRFAGNRKKVLLQFIIFFETKHRN